MTLECRSCGNTKLEARDRGHWCWVCRSYVLPFKAVVDTAPGINPVTGCKCSFSHKVVGDGCDICNPKLAEELCDDPEAVHTGESGASNPDG